MDAPTPGTRVTRRAVLAGGAGALALAAAPALPRTTAARAPGAAGAPTTGDRVILTNEDSCTLSVIDPVHDRVVDAVNLTSFDEDPRPPFRFVTGGVVPTHAAMLHKPLYHGAISVHGCAPSPDSTLLATVGRGSGNLYLVDTRTLAVVGNRPNPQAGADTNAEALTSGVMVGREPHEPTFAPNGRELWVTLRGEDRVAIVDVETAKDECAGRTPRGASIRALLPTMPGPAMVWFAEGGAVAFVVSQKTPVVDVLDLEWDDAGRSTVRRRRTLDLSARDPFGFTPFLKRTPEGAELWAVHKLADRVTAMAPDGAVVDGFALEAGARPNHLEFVDNARGRVAYVSCARVDEGAAGAVGSSRIAIVDRGSSPGRRRIVGHFASRGREAHGLWCDPAGTKLYVAHELDELPGTPDAGQTVCSVFDVTDPYVPRFTTRIALGELALPSGRLRHKKSINLVYVRPGAPSATA